MSHWSVVHGDMFLSDAGEEIVIVIILISDDDDDRINQLRGKRKGRLAKGE